MVLNLSIIFVLLNLAGCTAYGGYERYGDYDIQPDGIYEHRSSFTEDGAISMAYAVAYWDVIDVAKETDKELEVFYIWLRNNTAGDLVIDPNNLTLVTERGTVIDLSPLTGITSKPLTKKETAPRGINEGYAAFEVPKDLMANDGPSRLIYSDPDGRKAVRYIQVEDMMEYEGLVIEGPIRYSAPVYPRPLWYPYYFPYAYYPFDLRFYFLYHYAPRRGIYYYIPAPPRRRWFYVPPPPGRRELRRPPPRAPEPERRRREFPDR